MYICIVGTISVNYSAARNENLLEGEQAHAQADAPEAIPYSDFSTSFPMSENQGWSALKAISHIAETFVQVKKLGV